jgi:hypothetical protein
MGEKEQATSLAGSAGSASGAAYAGSGRAAAPGEGSPAAPGVALDPEPENVVKTKTKSNQSND